MMMKGAVNSISPNPVSANKMKLFETLQQRKAVRAYLDKPVEKEKIHAIFDATRHAPSGLNTPLWQVTGNTKKTLQSTIEIAFRAGNKGAADYEY
jgi:nitroreductase